MPKLVQKFILKALPIIMIVTSCISFDAYPQESQYTIVPFTPVKGLASSDVTSILQDSKKKLWVAHSAGISSYNGYGFENFLFSGETRLGRAYCIREDKDNGYLIGAESGLFKLLEHKMSFISFSEKSVPVYAFTTDKGGGTWMATSAGPAYFSKAQMKEVISAGKIELSKYILPAWKKMFPISNTSINIVSDEGQIFITDGYRIYSLAKDSIRILWESTVKADVVTGLAAAGNGELYFTSIFTGLHLFGKNKLHTFTGNFGNGNGLHIRNGQVFYFATTGIYRLDPQKRLLEAEVLLPDKYWEWGSYVIQDVENNFWIGTHEKLLHARKRLFSAVIQPELPGFDEVYSMREMKNGDLLVGGNHGMLFRKANGGELFSFTGKIFDRAQISDMIEDEDGNTWFGSGFQGIAVKSKTGKAIFTKKQGLRDNTNLFLLYTKDKQLYAAGDNGISKIIINPQEQQPAFKNWLSNSGSNNYAVFKTGIEKPGGGFLFGSSYGLFEIVRDSLRSIHIEDAPRKNHFITNISLDKKNNAWISTIGDGILVCRFTNTGSLKLIRQLTEADGLSSMLYLSMIIDKDDVIWAISYSGLTRIEKAGDMDFGVINFSLVHGFVNDNYHSAKMLQAKNGLIWIGTSSGLFNFHPGNALQFIGTSPVYLTQVSYGKGNKTSVYQPGHSGLEKPSKLELSYNINDISFDFNSINLSEPLSTIYKFRLLGLDSTWTDAGKNRTANFRNLRPGSYLFEVKASNGTNKWSKIESFAYVINPPFWNTWWFVAATVVLVCMLIFYLLKKRERMIKKGEGEKMEIQKLKTISYQYQLEIEQVINYFATSISEQKTVDDILWDVARNCISKLGFEDCVIYLIDLDRNILIQKAAWGPKTTEENKILYPIEIPLGHGIVGTVAETGKALIISDTSADPRYIIDDARRLSEITVPILNEGKVLGVIDSEYPEKNFYTSRHLHILTTIASLCAEKMAKVKSAHQAMEKEVEFFKLNQDLAASQLTALRSQMNPHFIFNSLNSIAQLVASKKNDEGLEYLNKFSKLMRLVLDESGNNLITLKDEKRMLDLYLQLESLRFGSSFSHSIHISEELDEEDTLLPSFIIHPIVENAVWHGLLHKEGKRRLIIDFMRKGSEQLVCIVKDNGIGIKAAREKKAEHLNGEAQESKGLQIIRERLVLLEKQYHIPTSIVLEDLEENHIITGTRVTIQLPAVYE